MGTIQNKRASGRGAPPDAYLPFFHATGEDAETRMVEAAKFCAWLVVAAILIGWILLGLSSIGCNPFDGIEDPPEGW